MKRIISATILVAMLLTASLAAVGCAKDDGKTTVTTSPTVSDNAPDKGISTDGTMNIHDVVFGRYGLVMSFSGNVAYMGNVSRGNFEYFLKKASFGQVTVMPELEAVMKDCDDKTVFAVHIASFEKDCTVEDVKITPKSELSEMITSGIEFKGFERYVSMGKVFFLTADEIKSLTCPEDKRILCGLAVYDEVWDEKDSDFDKAVDALSEGETLPVYVYYNTDSENSIVFTEDELKDAGKVAEKVEDYHNYVNSEDFGKLVSDGTIMKGLEDLVTNLGITENVIYIPHLSRLQTRMTAEQINNLPKGYTVEVRY